MEHLYLMTCIAMCSMCSYVFHLFLCSKEHLYLMTCVPMCSMCHYVFFVFLCVPRVPMCSMCSCVFHVFPCSNEHLFLMTCAPMFPMCSYMCSYVFHRFHVFLCSKEHLQARTVKIPPHRPHGCVYNLSDMAYIGGQNYCFMQKIEKLSTAHKYVAHTTSLERRQPE